MANAAFTCVLKINGASTAFSGEATTNTSGNTYQITDSTKRVLDPAAAITVYDGGVPVAAADVTVDFLFGKVTLSAPPGGAVTVDGSYLPLLSFAEVRGFEFAASGNMLDTTTMASTTSVYTRSLGLKDYSGSITSLDPLTTDIDAGGGTVTPDGYFTAGTAHVLDVDFPAGDNLRAWILIQDYKVGATWDSLVEATLNWVGVGQTATSGAGTNETASFGFGT